MGRDLLLVGGATALGQGALVIAAPLLTRLYDPGAFGALSVYTALWSVLVAIASLRYDFAIPIVRERVDAVHLVVLSVTFAVATSAVVALLVFVWGSQIAVLLGALPLAPFLWVLPVSVLLGAATQALAAWAVYERSFGAVAAMRAMQGVGQAIGQAVLGLFQLGPGGLILGDLGGRVLAAQHASRSLLGTLRVTSLSLESMRRQARVNWGFARVMTAASLLSALALQVPFLLIPVLFDLESSGQYFLAYRILVLPASLVAAAFSQVFLGEAAFRRADPVELHDLTRNAAVVLLTFSIPTYGIVTAVGPALIAAVFGDQWTLAGQYTQFIAPWLLLWTVANPISALLLVGRRERESLAFTAAAITVQTIAIGLGAVLQSLTVGIFFMSVTAVLLTIGSLWRFLRVASVRLPELGRPAARVLACTLPSLAAVILISEVLPEALLIATAASWTLALGLAAKATPEVGALLRVSR